MLVVMLSCIEDGMTIELLDELDVKFYGGEFDKGFDQDMLTTAAVFHYTNYNLSFCENIYYDVLMLNTSVFCNEIFTEEIKIV
ncbi:unnamed protein product [Rhizophagus irregularis]|nr:unnamed protein product [Rhizophagus irregularis]